MKEIKEVNYDESILLMKKLYLKSKDNDVAVFYDRGWGDSCVVGIYSIIVDGNGQKPKAYLSKETFEKLYANKIIGGNNLITYKARKNFPFLNKKTDSSTIGKSLYRDIKQTIK